MNGAKSSTAFGSPPSPLPPPPPTSPSFGSPPQPRSPPPRNHAPPNQELNNEGPMRKSPPCHSRHSHPNHLPPPPTPPSRWGMNAGKKVGFLFIVIVAIMKIGMAGFLVFKRR